MGKERKNSYRKMKRSLEERHTQIHGNLFEIFQRLQMSFSIRRECEHMVKISPRESFWKMLCPLDTAMVLTSDNFHLIFPPSPPLLSPSSFAMPMVAFFSKTLLCCHLYLVFTYIYSILIEKETCDRWNISNKFLSVFVCLSSGELFIVSVISILFLFLFFLCNLNLIFIQFSFYQTCITELYEDILILTNKQYLNSQMINEAIMEGNNFTSTWNIYYNTYTFHLIQYKNSNTQS